MSMITNAEVQLGAVAVSFARIFSLQAIFQPSQERNVDDVPTEMKVISFRLVGIVWVWLTLFTLVVENYLILMIGVECFQNSILLVQQPDLVSSIDRSRHIKRDMAEIADLKSAVILGNQRKGGPSTKARIERARGYR